MSFWQERLASDKTRIKQIDEILAAFANNGNIQSYTLDTGQDKQTVNRTAIADLVSERRKLMIEIGELEAVLSATSRGPIQMMPRF